jgi:hypothetical protein
LLEFNMFSSFLPTAADFRQVSYDNWFSSGVVRQ